MRDVAGVFCAALFLTIQLGCRSTPAKVTAEGDPATDAGASGLTAMAKSPDAGPWLPNPFEAAPVTHLAPVTLSVADAPVDLSDVAGGDETVGARVIGDRPYLLHCRDVVPLAAGFRKLDPVPFAVTDATGCTRVFGSRGSRIFVVAHHEVPHHGDDDGMIVAIDLATQTKPWRAEVPVTAAETDAGVTADIVHDSAHLAGERVLFLRKGEGVTSAVIALDATLGTVVWTRPKTGALAVAGADVLTLDLDGTVHALEPASGAPRWSTRLPDLANISPSTVAMAAGGGVVALGANDKVFLVDAATGARRGIATMPESADLSGLPTSLLVFAAPGGGAEVYAFGNQLARIDPSSGASLWTRRGYVRAAARGRDALFTDRAPSAYAALRNPDGLVHALDPATGHDLWSYGTSPRRVPSGRLVLDLLEVNGSEILAALLPSAHAAELFQRGRDELIPHAKTLEITVSDATDPLEVHLLAGDLQLTLDKDSRWSGPVHGRGTIWVRAISGITGHAVDPVAVDLETDAPTAKALLFVNQEFHQACAGP